MSKTAKKLKKAPAEAVSFFLDIRERQKLLMKEGYKPQPLIEQEAGAAAILQHMGYDTVALLKDIHKATKK